MTAIQSQTNRFNLTYDELVFCISQLNGVIPTIEFNAPNCSPGEGWESIVANIIAGAEFEPMPENLPDKLKVLNFWQRLELYAAIKHFWSYPGYSILDTKQRLIDIGLWH